MARVVIYSEDVLGKTMAGPAIRCWEFARELSKEHAVILISPNLTDLVHEKFKIISKKDPEFIPSITQAQVIISQQITPQLKYYAKKNGTKLILDAYCPMTLEILEQLNHIPAEKKELYILRSMHSQRFSFKMADGVICASDKQKDLWLGLLSTLPELSKHHKKDSTLNQFLDVVPYGLSSNPIPEKNGIGPREMFSLSPDDKILIWGGSISDWFDPCTLVRAMKLIADIRSDVKLIFMGVKHPNSKVPEMSVVEQAVALAKQLGVYNNSVFFNQEWIPYGKRHNFLREASLGVSIHSNHIETRFSFRTRILDYLWAGLPIIATEGDSFADLIDRNRLGIVVPYHDEGRLSQAILMLLNDQTLHAEIQKNVLTIGRQFEWEKVTQPIKRMIANFTANPINSLGLNAQEAWTIGCAFLTYYSYTFQILGKRTTLKKIGEKIKLRLSGG